MVKVPTAPSAVAAPSVKVTSEIEVRSGAEVCGCKAHAGKAGCNHVRHLHGQVCAVRAAGAVEGVFILWRNTYELCRCSFLPKVK